MTCALQKAPWLRWMAMRVLLLATIAITTQHSLSTAVEAGAAAPRDVGVWRSDRETYFPLFTKNAYSGARVVSLADWDGRVNPGFLAVEADREGTVEYWRNRAGEGGDVMFTRQWTTPPLPDGVTVVSAVTADLRCTGALDLLMQGSDGFLYISKHGVNGSSVPQAPRPITVVTSWKGTTILARVRHAATPQVSLAILESHYPNIIFVNEDGALVQLSWYGRDAAVPKTDEGGAQEESLDYHYIIEEIVPAASSGRTGAVGAPQGIAFGRKEIGVSSLAMADVNDDCVAELLYTVRDYDAQTLSLYGYHPFGIRRGFQSEELHVQLLEFSEADGQELGPLSVADVDGDGAVDFLFPWRNTSQTGHDGYTGIMVFYGKSFSLEDCFSITYSTSLLTNLSDLRLSDRGDVLLQLSTGFCNASFPARESPQWSEAVRMPDSPSHPLVLRSGDYNRDGLVDLVVPSSRGPLVLTATGVRGDNTRDDITPAFTCNYLNEESYPQHASSGDSRDDWRDVLPFFATMSAEPGRLDVVTMQPLSLFRTHDVNVFVNHALSTRNYYLLVSAINRFGGLALAQPGVVHQLAWEDSRMHAKYRRVTQLAQYAGFAMQPPRLLMGLGETFSYVRDYTVGAPSPRTWYHGSSLTSGAFARVRRWPSYLVPNSQVFAAIAPQENPEEWRLQLYLTTSRYRFTIGMALLVSLVGLGIPIVLLRWGEIRADLREWRRW